MPAAVLVLALGAPTAWWFLWFQHQRPSLRSGETYGIDVSNHEGAIDWPAVASDDIAFAYIKASEGGDFTDAQFTESWTGAGEAGVQRGARPLPRRLPPGAGQAEHFLRTAPP